MKKDVVTELKSRGRSFRDASEYEESLGPLTQLVGEWNNDELPGYGWNMIALPYKVKEEDNFMFNYRLVVNQYNETLKFNKVDDGIPNRGIKPSLAFGQVEETDQTLAAIDYEQSVVQIASDDFPKTGETGKPNTPIHHEPGLFLYMLDQRTNDLDIARLATIPHGDSVLALGRSSVHEGPPKIPDWSGLPSGTSTDLNTPYLAPYKHFHDNLFEEEFDPVHPNELLKQANEDVNILRTTTLELNTAIETGGIVNIPFIVKQADAVEMKSIFWIQEVESEGEHSLRLQYAQIVMLDFFRRSEGDLIRWPHVSINTMTKKKK